jgi:hypothetical protein
MSDNIANAFAGPKVATGKPFIHSADLHALIAKEVETYKRLHPSSLRLFTEGTNLIGGVPMVTPLNMFACACLTSLPAYGCRFWCALVCATMHYRHGCASGLVDSLFTTALLTATTLKMLVRVVLRMHFSHLISVVESMAHIPLCL